MVTKQTLKYSSTTKRRRRAAPGEAGREPAGQGRAYPPNWEESRPHLRVRIKRQQDAHAVSQGKEEGTARSCSKQWPLVPGEWGRPQLRRRPPLCARRRAERSARVTLIRVEIKIENYNGKKDSLNTQSIWTIGGVDN